MDNQSDPNYLAIKSIETDNTPPSSVSQINNAPTPIGLPDAGRTKQSRKNRLPVILSVLLIIGVAGIIIWRTLLTKDDKGANNVSSGNAVSNSVVKPDMNFVDPVGWSIQAVNTSRNTVKTYTSSDGSGAKLTLIMQDGKGRTEKDGPTPTSNLKEIELKSALFGDQYTAKYDNVSNVVTSFHLRVYFDVLMEEKYYNQPKYQQVYQAFLDSFVPNGTTNNQ